MTRFLNYDTKGRVQKNLWCIMTRDGAKKSVRKRLLKRCGFCSEIRKSPVLLDFFASRHCINNDV
jgi:hypothetical protein